jgi:HEAT repeat protein
MDSRRTRAVVVVILLVALVVGLISAFRLDPLDLQIRELLGEGGKIKQGPIDRKLLDELRSIGPKAAPFLAKYARVPDSTTSELYERFWLQSPGWLQNELAPPIYGVGVRRTAMSVIAEMGPLVARRCGEEVIAGLSDSSTAVQGESLKAAAWLAVDSSEVREAFSLAVAKDFKSLVRGFRGLDHVDLLWGKTGSAGIVVTNALVDSDEAYMASLVLSRMGTNAAPALPFLVDLYRQSSVASETLGNESVPPQQGRSGTRKPNAKVISARANAVETLGNLGGSGPEVLKLIAEAWNDDSPRVRVRAAKAVGMMGEEIHSRIPQLLEGLEDGDNAALGEKMMAMGSLGPSARGAIPVLLRLTSEKHLRGIVDDPDSKIASQSLGGLRVTAQMALCRIDPMSSGRFIPNLAEQIGTRWSLVECLIALEENKADVKHALEPLLASQSWRVRMISAYVLLHHFPDHRAALELLHTTKTSGKLRERLTVAGYLFRAIGEVEGVEELIREGLTNSEGGSGQSAIDLAEVVGAFGLPALESIQWASWAHKDQHVRRRAGRYLIEYALDRLPAASVN